QRHGSTLPDVQIFSVRNPCRVSNMAVGLIQRRSMMTVDNLDFSRYQLGWSDDQIPVFKPKKGINEAIVREMSGIKSEEPWMLDFRLNALKRFEKKPMLEWFASRMPALDFNDIY